MIASLRGTLADWSDGQMVIDVNGVGYLVFCSARTMDAAQTQSGGGDVSLLIETNVREDHIHLYGFADAAERDWFRLLTTVQGVGAKVGLAILSVLPPDQIGTAIVAQDKAMLTRADGVGPKLAQRLLSELKDKAAKLATTAALSTAVAGDAGGASPSPADAGNKASMDAVSALANLGYGRAEALTAVSAVMARGEADGSDLNALIPLALKELAG
ncbi:MAG: Holliday junction branch migration protein RuvA [Alphaproteobacteria bacterium]